MVPMPDLQPLQIGQLGQEAPLGIIGRRHIDADIRKMSQLANPLKLLDRQWGSTTCHQSDSVPMIINGDGITPCSEKLNDSCFISEFLDRTRDRAAFSQSSLSHRDS